MSGEAITRILAGEVSKDELVNLLPALTGIGTSTN
jgi:hypothetical protein